MRTPLSRQDARPRRPLVALTTLSVLAAGLVATGSAAAAPAYAAACSGTKGVTVVVDFTKLGGKVKTACDAGNPASGLAALTGAGFTYAFVPRQPGFVCTIDKKPNPCNGAPTKAYWSYWHAKPHGKWVYSSTGAGNYHPAPGTVQGWAFGASKPPRISPP
jgi:hypothetical protein